MAGETAGTIFTLLLGLGLLGTVWARWLSTDATRDALAAGALPLAGLVAAGAMGGSLWFSEVANFTPCSLCWYQRIAMYPLAVILPLAAWRRDDGIRPYAIALAGIGSIVSIYHVQLERFPDQGSACSTGASCTFRWIEIFGFATIPVLALASFVLVLLLLTTTPAGGEWVEHTDDDAVPAATTTPRLPQEIR
jgi:disulfide bond formation protein DsbB